MIFFETAAERRYNEHCEQAPYDSQDKAGNRNY